jgi:hypothetical protein
LGDQLSTGEILVAFSKDPVLALWQAMKRLDEVNARTDSADISKILAEAEMILFGLVLALIKRPGITESFPATAAEGANSLLSPFAIN